MSTSGTLSADALFGFAGPNVFDGKGAPSGSQDYVQGNGGNDTFVYNVGYGRLEINEASNAGDQSVLQMGAGLTAADIAVTSDSWGNLYLTDGTTGDRIELDNVLRGGNSGPQLVTFTDGTSLTQAQLIDLATTGTTAADSIYGQQGKVAQTFDGKGAPSGSQDYVQGNGGNDTFVYNVGYGRLEISEASNAGDQSVLQMGAGLTAADITVASDSWGDLFLTDGTAGDRVELDNVLRGGNSGPQLVTFTDGTSLTPEQLVSRATTGTTGANSIYGDQGNVAQTFDGKGAPSGSQDFIQGNGGNDTFVYNVGYGRLEINEASNAGDQSVLQMGAGLTAADITVASDSWGDLYLTDGTTGDRIELDNVLRGGNSGPQLVTFTDGTSLTQAQLIGLATTGTTAADSIYGQQGKVAQIFDGKGAPSGSQDYVQGNGGNDTFVYNVGYGRLEINEASNAGDQSVLQMGAGLTAADITVASDSWGDLYLTDGTTGDRIELDNVLRGGNSGPQLVTFTDGTSLTQAQLIGLATTGTTAADSIYGQQGKVAQIFDGKGAPSGSQDYVQGNGGNDTFVYNVGYGRLEISEASNAGDQSVLQMGAGLTAADITVASDSWGNLYLTDGTTGDRIELDNVLRGGNSGPQLVTFTDGTSLTQAQLIDLATTGTTAADSIYGQQGKVAQIFDGKGAPSGSQDYVQGNGGNDTFVYNVGYGRLEISEASNAGDQSVLQMGAGLTAADITVASDSWGNLYLTDGTTGDRIELDNVLRGGNSGPQLVTFTDGTSLTQAQLIGLATTGTTAADSIYGQQGKVAQIFDGKGAPSGSQDYVQGNGGNDTFVYNVGYGRLEISEASNAGDQSVLQMGAGLTADNIRIASSGSNPSDAQIFDGRSGDIVTLDDLLSSSLDGPQDIKFIDGSSITRAKIVSDAQSSQAFSAASGNTTLRSNATSITVTGDTGSENLWFQQQNQDLLVEIIGSSSVMRVPGWFSGNSSLASIVTMSGQQIDDANLHDVVTEMVGWSKENSAFNAASASSLPTDDALQNAVQRDWQETQRYGN